MEYTIKTYPHNHTFIFTFTNTFTNTGKQCRERYRNHLSINIKKGEWTDEEDRYNYISIFYKMYLFVCLFYKNKAYLYILYIYVHTKIPFLILK